MKFRIWSVRPALAALAMSSVAATGAAAQESISLSLISGYPPPATWVGAAVDAYAPKVDELLAKTGNYKIDWNMAISGQVVKPRGELEGVETGLGDMGIIVTAFHADKVPLYDVSFKTPFTSIDLGVISATTAKMVDAFPEYDKIWGSFNQVALAPTGAVDLYMVWSATQAKSFADLKGRKVGAAGPNLPWVTAAGATGVQTNLADAYNSLTTGIYDNMIVWRQAAGAFKLCEPAPFALDAKLGGVNGFSLNVNKDIWDGLPDEVKKALQDATPAWVSENIDRVNKGAKGGLAKCEKEYGTVVTELSSDDVKAWAFALPNIAQEWAKAQDAKGLPGTPILKAWMDEMRAQKQLVVRNWDRE
jgi:TRAP-type C4-dicarboxylate transport system substrate-binding protein